LRLNWSLCFIGSSTVAIAKTAYVKLVTVQILGSVFSTLALSSYLYLAFGALQRIVVDSAGRILMTVAISAFDAAYHRAARENACKSRFVSHT